MAVISVLLALSANALVKQVLALILGTRGYAWRLGFGLLLILSATWATFLLIA